MKVTKIKLKNFRLLRDVEIQLDESTTIIVGKNNSGKTSFIEGVNLFINNKKISSDDFNIEVLKEFIESSKIEEDIPRIQLYLTFEYNDIIDSLENINPFITTLEDENTIEILLEYSPKNNAKFLEKSKGLNFQNLKVLIEKEYSIKRSPYKPNEDFDEVTENNIKNLLSFFPIEAQRNLDDSSGVSKNRFSQILNTHYEKQLKEDNEEMKEQIAKIEEQIQMSNGHLDQLFLDFFNAFMESFKQFGFPGLNEGNIKIKSNLEVSNILKNMLKIYYENEDVLLPEKYNGLGYTNLLYIITKVLSFQMINQEKNNSMLCLIGIEEPEAHMHSQMQKVFIEKINDFLKKQKFNCQIIITTHSTEIISSSELQNIRYFNKIGGKTSIKDLIEFKAGETNIKNLDFLKKYIKLGTAHMFFADKIILVEGIVERLLMPLFIRNIDSENSDYISLVEIGGAYMHKFKELLEFLEIKTLIITDIDSNYGTKKAPKKIKKESKGKRKNKSVKEKAYNYEIIKGFNQKTTNETLKQWIPKEESIENLLKKTNEEKIVKNIRITYQTNRSDNPEILKCGRSFEEAFIIDNIEFLDNKRDKLSSIKYSLNKYKDTLEIKQNSYEIYDFIDRNNKKSEFAFDLLMNDGWKTPEYIREGLEWLLKK
ncbi:ATP-dependent nuclease [Cetobacterium sp.]|uniref:ATP-dependent nuclease n=1 Tax=Cetobacterium sp. TaxID=2071632 RepID=UPI003F3FF972